MAVTHSVRRSPVFAVAMAALVSVLAQRAGAEIAEYQVTFDATWSAATHPTAYPTGGHFSPLVGGTHNASASFWVLGGIATLGIERMAELGATPTLLGEVSSSIAVGDAFSQITGAGISSPNMVSTTFFMQSDYPLVTLVTMIAPSPDWFVGVSGLVLRSGGTWLDDVVVSLEPYDAGTDSGSEFTAANADTDPQNPIAGFSGPPFAGTSTLGTFTFELLQVTLVCADGLDNDGDGLIDLADPGCDDASDDFETSAALVCDDGLDNDGDTLVDSADPGCDDPLDTSELGSAQCDDGVDNDGDTFADSADPGCEGPTDPSELGLVECDDGIDNDGDLAIDYPADPHCVDPLDVSEAEFPPGVPLLPPLAALMLAAALVGLGGRQAQRAAGAATGACRGSASRHST
jgi:hypothetical protein